MTSPAGCQHDRARARIWVRMSNWLGDIIMSLPLVRAMREAHPGAELTLFAKNNFAPFLRALEIADKIEPLPARASGLRGLGYWNHFWKLRAQRPDTHVLFTNSLRGDIEAWLAGSPRRLGIRRPGKPRPLLTHGWRLPRELDPARNHQTRVWERWLRESGLVNSVSFAPVIPPAMFAPSSQLIIGMVCGAENSFCKCWPPQHWRALIKQLSASPPANAARIRLFGTERDAPVAASIAGGLPPATVENLAGKTSLCEFAERLVECDFVISNDTGGMHLANLIGVPVIALFGPTNPVRTGPVFESLAIILQPEGCPATGGLPVENITPARVAGACRAMMENPSGVPRAAASAAPITA